MKKFRHGDVIIKKIDNTDLKLESAKEVILAEGEMTGHFHKVLPKTNDVKIEFVNTDEGITFKIDGGNAILVHEEHETIELEPGIYQSYIQQEYDPIEYRRKVMD
jgi:hypothetical protein